MAIELDHLFICTDVGGPAGDALVRFGLREGLPNRHLGQGTACRRFSFQNALLELLWVCDPEEAQSEATRRTMLWERWSARNGGASPFGICVRPACHSNNTVPFPAREYRPAYLPEPLALHLGEAGIEEPMWIYIGFAKRADRERHFAGHPAGIREVTRVTLVSPVSMYSKASKQSVDEGVLKTVMGPAPSIEIEFDRSPRNRNHDFRPQLPLIVRF